MFTSKTRNYITKILVDIMFYGGIATCIALPFIMPWLLRFVGVRADLRMVYTIILLASGIPAVYIVYRLKCMFKTLVGGNPFVDGNVSALRHCAVASAVIATVYLVRLFMWFTIAAAIIVVIFALLSLFSLTLKDLFKQAVAYKEETDWTV